MGSLRHLAPASVGAFVLVVGCAQSNRLGGHRPPTDAGPAPSLDGGRPPDAGPDGGTDGGLPGRCADRAVDFAYTDHGNGGVPASAPSDLPVGFGLDGTCWCGEQIRCEAVYRPGAGVLDLHTEVCGDLPCKACFPSVVGACPIPSMGDGPVPVFVNGAFAFELTSTDAVPAIGPVEQALTVPETPLPACPLEPRTGPALAIEGACVPPVLRAGVPHRLRLAACIPCGHAFGTCTVERVASRLTVRPASTPTACDVDCPDPCTPQIGDCALPPLDPGAYTLDLPDHPSVDLTVVHRPTDRPEVCVGDL